MQLTRAHKSRRRMLKAQLTKIKYDPRSIKWKAVWRYRVEIDEDDADDARAFGLKRRRLWDTLIGDDSRFCGFKIVK